MDKADITKIAPTLSTKERIKLLISDWQKILAGKKSLLSEEEKKALLSFTNAEDFRQYEYFESIYKWCGLFLWRDEIEKTFLRIAIGFYRIGGCSDQQETTQFLEKEIKELFEYKAAVETIEKELDLPLFDETTYSKIKSYWSWTENFVTKHNEIVEGFEAADFERDEFLVAFGSNKEKCLIKRLEPDKEVVAQMIVAVKELVNSEIELHEYIIKRVVEIARR